LIGPASERGAAPSGAAPLFRGYSHALCRNGASRTSKFGLFVGFV
jgi:hypothetical protein